MTIVSPIHTSIFERREPRMSAKAMAEYLVGRPDQQERILSDSKFPNPNVTAHYTPAVNAIVDFCVDMSRDHRRLEEVKDHLNAQADNAEATKTARDKAARNADAIAMFQDGMNVWGISGLRLERVSQQMACTINGLEISVRPSAIVRGQGDGYGLAFIIPTKVPDPRQAKKQETRDQRLIIRQELARYLLALGQMADEAAPLLSGDFRRDLCFALDLISCERIDFPTQDYTMRRRAASAACTQIVRAWDRVNQR